MKGRLRAIYLGLVDDLIAEGFASRCDQRMVALCASTVAHVENLERQVASLGSLTVEGSTGQERIHPLLGELRAHRRELATMYAALLLTPRSRSASRMSEDAAKSARSRSQIGDDGDTKRVLSLLG